MTGIINSENDILNTSPATNTGSRYGRFATRLESYAYISYLVIVAIMPLPLGLNRPWAWSLLEISVLSIFSIYLLSYVANPRPWPKAVEISRLPLFVLFLWLLYLYLQTVEFPAAFVEAVSPGSYFIYSYTLGSLDSMAIALEPGLAKAELLKATSYTVLALLTLSLITTRKRVKTLAWVLFVVGFGEALYGLMSLNGTLLWNPTPNSTSGTYVNQNHLAGLLEMTIPLGVGLYLYKTRHSYTAHNFRQRLRNVTETLMRKKLHVLVMTTIMFGVLLLTTSRGGTMALLMAFFVASCYARFSNMGNNEARLLPLFLGMSIVAIIWFGVAGITNKVAAQGIDEQRVEVWRSSTAIVENYPVFGVGGGSWKNIFPHYRSLEAGIGTYEHAHNDYLEEIVEQGFAGVGLLALVLMLSLKQIFRALHVRQDPLAVSLLLSITTAVLAMMIHAIFDFNFQIPANMCYFIVLLTLGMAISSQGRKKYNSKSSSVRD